MINKVILTGRLTTDIELRYTNDNTPYAFFTLAVNRRSGNDQTDFVSCVAWRGTAELMNNYLKKGSLIGVEGRLEVFNNQKDGQWETRTTVNVNQVTFLEAAGSNGPKKAPEQEPAKDVKMSFDTDNAKPSFESQSESSNDEINFEDIKF